jgi:hypothetical protein
VATNAVASCFWAQFHQRGLTKATNAAASSFWVPFQQPQREVSMNAVTSCFWAQFQRRGLTKAMNAAASSFWVPFLRPQCNMAGDECSGQLLLGSIPAASMQHGRRQMQSATFGLNFSGAASPRRRMQRPAPFGFHSCGLNATWPATNAVSYFWAQFQRCGLTKATNAAASSFWIPFQWPQRDVSTNAVTRYDVAPKDEKSHQIGQ